MPAAYIDSSALLKLVVRENETSALEADLAERDGLVVSAIALVECRRAARRAALKRLLQRIDELFESVYLIAVTPAILERAALIEPLQVRSMDAIHIATALSLDDRTLDLITYDGRMADAARTNGLRVVRPAAARGN